jgi:argininosuccinate lyase
LATPTAFSIGMPFRTAHRIVGRIAASGSRPGLAELDEIAQETAGYQASERGFSEADLERALDPKSNVALRGPEWELLFVHLQHSFRQEGLANRAPHPNAPGLR